MFNIKVLIVLVILVSILGLGAIFLNQSKTNLEKPSSQQSEIEEKIKEERIEVLVQGIKRPHGIGEINGKIHIGSEVDKALLKVENNRVEKVASLDFAHDMFAWSNNSALVAIFKENRLVEIDEKREVKDIFKGLGGPNGITYDSETLTYYVSNYNFGTVISFKREDLKPELVVGNLKGPAGLAFDGFTRRLFIASYLDGSIAIVRDGAILQTIKYPGLEFIESLSLDSEKNLRATASENGKGVVVVLKENGTYEVLLKTELPNPLVGYFTENKVYLVSPNDSQGRVLKAKLY